MRRVLRLIGWGFAALAAMLIVLVAALFAGANTDAGRTVIARLAPRFTGGVVTIRGLSGRFPDRLKAAELSLHDTAGVWARIEDLDLDWSPLRLVRRTVAVDRFAASEIDVLRRPVPSGGGSSAVLPTEIDTLHVGRLNLAAAVTGTAASLALDGSAALVASGEGHAVLVVKGIGAPGNYRFAARLGAADLDLRLAGQEPAHGLVSTVAGLPGLGKLSLDAAFAGPRSAVAGQLRLAVGPARLAAHGTLDLDHKSADLAATASAPAMAPRPDLAWQSAALDARIVGPIERPNLSAMLDIRAISAAGASVARIAGRLIGNAGAVRLEAALSGLRVPGPRPDLLAAAPVEIAAKARLDQSDRPIRFSLSHPLVTADGTAATAGRQHGTVVLALPDLAPLAGLFALDLKGHAALKLTATLDGGTTRLDGSGTLGLTGGTAPAPALVGDAARLTLSATATRTTATIQHFNLTGRKIAVSATGRVAADRLALDWRLALPDLASAEPTLAGGLRATGRVSGPSDDLAATADLSGTLGPVGKPPGPLAAAVRLDGLPGRPQGHVDAQGVVLGAPLRLAFAANRAASGEVRLAIEAADWKSTHAQGNFVVPPGGRFPLGEAEFRMIRLDDLRPLIGRPVTGTLAASLATAETGGHQRAELRLAAGNLGLAGAGSGGRAEINATVTDPLTRPLLEARIAASGRAPTGAGASAEVSLAGPEDSLGFTARFLIRDPKTGDVRLDAAGAVDAVTRVAMLRHLETLWKGQDVRLLAPARVGFGNAITLDHLRLGLRQATLEANGRVSPTLDLTVALRNLSADIAAAFVPGIAAGGVLRGDARLSGTPQRPVGRIALAAQGLRLRGGPGRALPATNLTASADIAGTNARLDARLEAGPDAALSVRGQVPTAPAGPLALHAAGAVDLKLLDPLLTAGGRRARGKIALDAEIGGTLAAPRIGGGAHLAKVTLDDFGTGVHITDIGGSVEAAGTALRFVNVAGRAGQGTLGVGGTVDLSAPGMPVNLVITARDARPLATDLLTATLDAAMSLRGAATGELRIGGTVDVRHAEIQIPKRMPAQVQLLPVRVIGAPAPPPAPAAPPVGLDLTVSAQRVTISGRGLFAELAGRVTVRGTTAAPQPLGSFHMVRGTLNMVGQTLSFDRGEIGFNGGSLTNPSLDFAVDSLSSTMSAQLLITGTASHPNVTVTSTPEMPVDQVLARMLYPNNSSPSAIELAEVASALAELGGVGGGGGGLLGGIQQRLGLEQLSVGTAGKGSATVQVGRYVRPGVWVGAQQGAGGNSSQARVEIDVRRGLKVFGTVGNGQNTTPGATPAQSAGTSLGLKYQFEY
jgi:translocation and assembly module TamB